MMFTVRESICWYTVIIIGWVSPQRGSQLAIFEMSTALKLAKIVKYKKATKKTTQTRILMYSTKIFSDSMLLN